MRLSFTFKHLHLPRVYDSMCETVKLQSIHHSCILLFYLFLGPPDLISVSCVCLEGAPTIALVADGVIF